MAEIGATLREARMRARIDVSEIEAQTKIRAKYLRALENEEWDLLPGPTFVKSFLRTYATALGLDGRALLEEYRLSYERPSEPPEPIVTSSRRMRMGGGPGAAGPSRGYVALVSIVVVVILLLVVGLVSGGGGGGKSSTTAASARVSGHRRRARRRSRTSAAPLPANVISVQMRATGTVYICLLGENGQPLVDGRTLEAGQSTPEFYGKYFELTLGNNSVALTIDGTPRVVPESADAIGYSITKAGRRTLEPGRLPTCT